MHASKPRALYKMFPQSIEVQMMSGDAGDFWVIQEDIEVKDMEKRRPRKEGREVGRRRRRRSPDPEPHRRLGEAPREWNTMVVEARGRTLRVWINGDLVNEGENATASEGRIALQAEGTEVEFRRVDLMPLLADAK